VEVEKFCGCFARVPGLKKKVQDPIDAWMQVYYIRTRKRKRKKNGTFPSIITTITTETGCYRASWLDPAAAAPAHVKLLHCKLLNSLSMLTCIFRLDASCVTGPGAVR